MKFVCADESGSPPLSDAFVMCGLMVDADVFFKMSSECTKLLADITGLGEEFKTNVFIKGEKYGKKFDPSERIKKLTKLYEYLVENNYSIFGTGLSFNAIKKAINEEDDRDPQKIARVFSGLFISELVQNRMHEEDPDFGQAMIVFDHHTLWRGVSEKLKQGWAWEDGLCLDRSKGISERDLRSCKGIDRSSCIVDRKIYSVKSEWSSLIQMADLVSYIYRRRLNFWDTKKQACEGERAFIGKAFNALDPLRLKLKDVPYTPDAACTKLLNDIKHTGWKW